MQTIDHFTQLFKTKPAPAADIREVTDLDSSLGRQALQIYERSFPEIERDPVENIATSLRNENPDKEVTHLRVLIEDDVVAGFTYFSSYKEYYLGFLKFIAVREDIRGKGVGPILLQDAIQQVRADGVWATGWSYLGLVLEVERPEMAENDQDRQIRERRIQFYKRNGAVLIKDLDYIAPPLADDKPSIPFHLMVLRAVPKYGMQYWLRQNAVKALLVEGYGEEHDSWFVQHALKVRQRAKYR
ncbi:MAG: GNAT family N-acetyltransferase [Anaerolineales bacterium]|nr:GNAT family N-acetyltransferase [Anaerolineales bacterium]